MEDPSPFQPRLILRRRTAAESPRPRRPIYRPRPLRHTVRLEMPPKKRPRAKSTTSEPRRSGRALKKTSAAAGAQAAPPTPCERYHARGTRMILRVKKPQPQSTVSGSNTRTTSKTRPFSPRNRQPRGRWSLELGRPPSVPPSSDAEAEPDDAASRTTGQDT